MNFVPEGTTVEGKGAEGQRDGRTVKRQNGALAEVVKPVTCGHSSPESS